MNKLILVLSITFFAIGCSNEDKDCYDSSLVHDNACTADCPGFIGCDGNEYCNECEAARLGIGPE